MKTDIAQVLGYYRGYKVAQEFSGYYVGVSPRGKVRALDATLVGVHEQIDAIKEPQGRRAKWH